MTAPGAEGGIEEAVANYFEALAAKLGSSATLNKTSETYGADRSYVVWDLVPEADGAARVRWNKEESDPSSTYLTLGEFTWVEVFTFPKKPSEHAVATVEEIVEPVLEGRFYEVVWQSRRTGDVTDTGGYIQYTPGSKWRVIGSVPGPRFVFDRIFDKQVIEYAPYALID